MNRKQREAVTWNLPRVQPPGQAREVERLEEDLESSPLRGRELQLRLRNFRPAASGYLASLGGPLAYMTRLRQIADATAAHEAALEAARDEIVASTADPDVARARWLERVGSWSFDEVNELIDRHNRWYPVESRLPMDPARGDFALVNGKSYRLGALDAAWALERFPVE